jgi:hypothetical protein
MARRETSLRTEEKMPQPPKKLEWRTPNTNR